MSEWLVCLQGHQHDLDTLSELLDSLDLNVKREGEYYYLRCSAFDPLADTETVRERAIELLDIVNGVAKLRLENYLPVELAAVAWITEEGELRHSVVTSTTLRWRTLEAQSPTEIGSLVDVARGDNRVADVLHFFQKDDWDSFYKVWELISDAVGGEHKLKKKPWINKRATTRFKQTAQSRKILGDAARHASECYAKPIKGGPMTLDEARGFVSSVIEAWVDTM